MRCKSARTAAGELTSSVSIFFVGKFQNGPGNARNRLTCNQNMGDNPRDCKKHAFNADYGYKMNCVLVTC